MGPPRRPTAAGHGRLCAAARAGGDCQAGRAERSSAGVQVLWLATALLGPPERPAVEFRWDAPAGCPGEAEVTAELERLLGGPLVGRGGQRVTAIARVRQEPGAGYDLRLWTVRDEGTLQRSLVHAECEAVAKAAALIAAMAIDPSALDRVGEAKAAAEVAAEATTVTDPEPPPLAEPEVKTEVKTEAPASVPSPAPGRGPRARALRGAVRVGAGVAYGDLPGVGALTRMTAALVWPRARLELEASYGPVRKARYQDREDRGVDLQMATATLRGCSVWRVRRVDFPICGGAEIGAMYGRGVGFALTNEGRLLFAALQATAMVLFAPHPRVALGATVEGAVHVARPRFVVEGVGEVYRAAPASVRALGVIELRFP